MQPLTAVLLLLAPMASVREPVGHGAWERRRDPLTRRVSSLMLGRSLRRGFVTVLPLFARVPSEAGGRYPDGPLWADPERIGKEIQEAKYTYLRVRNEGRRPMLVAAGAVFSQGDREVCVARDALVSGEFAALLPAQPTGSGQPSGRGRFVGVLPPAATGLLVHGGGSLDQSVFRAWALTLRAKTFSKARASKPVLSMVSGLTQSCAALAEDANRTVVGAVFLIAGRPAAAHVFSSNELFLLALPDLLTGLAIQARHEQFRLGGSHSVAHAALTRQAEAADGRARALAYLRTALDIDGVWSESYGEGREVVLRNTRDRVIGHAVLDHRRTVVHFGLYSLGGLWPGVRSTRGPLPPPPTPPEGGGTETAPGEVDRKPRPSESEQRQRDRRPDRVGGGSAPAARGRN